MPKFDESNRKRGIAQYCSEASKAAAKTTGINSLLSAKEDLSGCAAMAALYELNQKKGITPSYLEESSKLVKEIERNDRMFSEKGNELSYEKTVAGMGAAGYFGNSIDNNDCFVRECKKIKDKEELNVLEKTELKALLHNSQKKENNMGLQLNSRDYKDFLRLVEESDWVRQESYELFYKNNNIRRERIWKAIYCGEIKSKIKELDGGTVNDDLQLIDENQRLLVVEHYIYSDSSGLADSLLLKGASFLAWLKKEYPYEGEAQAEHTETAKGKISELCLADILNLITPEMYPDGLTGQGKSAITNSLNTLKEQLPKAFELCSALVMEAMPCESRKEPLKYSRDDIENRADKEGISTPMARQIHKALPAMLKK